MLNGSVVALVTPFDASGGIDFAAVERLVGMHLEAGTHGLVVGGSTGESACLRAEELHALLEAVVDQVAGQVPVIAGTGTAATSRTIEMTRAAAARGADAALVVTPYYVRPTQAGLEAHFRAVADASDMPIILYNVPSRTSVDLMPETVERLATHGRIIGIKEAVARMDRITALCAFAGPDFTVLSGDDPSCLQAMLHGAKGVISVAANVVPEPMRRLCEAMQDGRRSEAERVESTLRPLFDQLAMESNPIPVKWALSAMSLCRPDLRLPLTPLSPRFQQGMRHCLAELGLQRA